MVIQQGGSMKKILGLLLSSILCLSTFFTFSSEVKAEELPYEHNKYDYTVIPDAYNTGCKGELVKDYAYFSGNYPEDDKPFYLSYKIQDIYGESYKNIEFTRNIIVGQAKQRSMTFINCKFTTDSTYSVSTYNGSNWDENVTLTFVDCDFTNYGSAAVQTAPNVKFLNCKFYEAQGDGAKGVYNMHYENCYFYNIGFAEGAHADGIQWTNGANGSQVINCRFDMPYYDKYIPNAAIFFVLEHEANGYDNVFKDIYATGGNYTFYYGAKEEASVIENTVFDNINIGCSYQYGPRSIGDRFSVPAEEFHMVDTLFVSSVYQENDKIKLYATNYTNEEKTLICVTDKTTEEIIIPACPIYAEGINYTSFEQFPFNVEVELDGNKYVVCYNDEVSEANQIRYVNFNEESLENPEGNESNTETSQEGKIKFLADIGSWFEVSIPNAFKILDLRNVLNFSVNGDISGTEALSVTTEESVIMTNENNDELVADILMEKNNFSFDDLAKNTKSSINISVDKLPAGKFTGDLPIYIKLVSLERNEDDIITGTLTDTINYRLKDGVLTISGTGDMPDYNYTYEEYLDQIETVVIEEGIKTIGLACFQDCTNLTTVYIGSDVELIKGNTFKRCTNLTSLYVPISVTTLYNAIFQGITTDIDIYYEGTEEQLQQIVGFEQFTEKSVHYEQSW